MTPSARPNGSLVGRCLPTPPSHSRAGINLFRATYRRSKSFLHTVAVLPVLAWALTPRANATTAADLDSAFHHPPEAARPWIYWYWMNAAVSRAGITADLEAMKQAGLEGAYLMPIKGPTQPPQIEPPVVQLSPEWWRDVRFAFSEADRLGLKLALQDCDGFATAGGPWITPELSMQKVVWSETSISGGAHVDRVLEQPPTNEGYYRDIAVYAVPDRNRSGGSRIPDTGNRIGEPSVRTAADSSTRAGSSEVPASTHFQTAPERNISDIRFPVSDINHPASATPIVSSSLPGPAPQFLADGSGGVFRSVSPCWIQYTYAAPITCRAITISLPPAPNAYQPNTYGANRLIVQASDDGAHFRTVTRLVPPRHGWQDGDADITHAIAPITARYFRFVYDPTDAEPGAEDLDSAKWKPSLKVQRIRLWTEPRIDGFEGKSGAVWRIAAAPNGQAGAPSDAIPLQQLIDVSSHVDATGHLSWDAPPGRWTILRMGHTSTGHRNDTGGGGKGLECDKFNPVAIRTQFDHWFGEATRQVGPELARRVLTVFHVDSWECASQNWSPVFRDEFTRRRGYDPLPYLPAMAGVPIDSPEVSERFLHDVRTTIAELLVDRFFGTMSELAHEHGCQFSAESVAPTMESDGMAHYGRVDIPMGEFWLRSPTNDKLNDVLDAVSGAHVYGRPIAQMEAFTELVLRWDEAPVLLKALQDRNYCFGVNRFVYHVFAENPWTDRRPGMTLSGVGTFFQRDQTWWKPGRAWFDYAERCDALLQEGSPVADVAVFTGEDIPRRAYVPWHLASTLPGMIASIRDIMAGRKIPQIMDAGDWVDPLHGYAYDSINRDALLRVAQVRDGRLVMPGGASYRILVVPAANLMNPLPGVLSPEVLAKVAAFAASGGVVVLGARPERSPSLANAAVADAAVADLASRLWPAHLPADGAAHPYDKGTIVTGAWRDGNFDRVGLTPDVTLVDSRGGRGVLDEAVAAPAATAGSTGDQLTDGPARRDFAWVHRAADGWDIYFVSNQRDAARELTVSFRQSGREPEVWDPVTGEQRVAATWRIKNGRTEVALSLPASGSAFVVFRKATRATKSAAPVGTAFAPVAITGSWQVQFDPAFGGPTAPVEFPQLTSWTDREEPAIRYYSGTAMYRTTMTWTDAAPNPKHVWLDLGEVHDIAEVKINGVPCGIAWTSPFRVDVAPALQHGANTIEVAVTNTWFNRLAGDQKLPPMQRITWTTAPDRTSGKPLLRAGLLGPVVLRAE